MKIANAQCNQSRVSALLVEDLSETQVEVIEQHLQQCPSCRSSLESQAATAETWHDAQQYLRDDDDDLERIGDSDARSRMPPGVRELIDALAPSEDPGMIGRLGPYEISGVIGAGGMGVVLKAFDPSLGRFIAVKVLAPRFWHDALALERFSREARSAASIIHDNVIEIYGVSEAATMNKPGGDARETRIPFFTMPYLRGDSLQKRIDWRGSLQTHEILRIAEQIAEGLQAAHSRGLVHRDIKPANILLSDGSERVRITDFGLAHSSSDSRLTQTGAVAGTPAYMAPEQVHGEKIDHRSDLFSLGSVMYAMCTGRPPFTADSEYGLLNQVVTVSTTPISQINPSIPDWLAAIIDRLHANSPKDRYQSAGQLAVDLQKCLAHLQQPESFTQPRNITKLVARYRKKTRPRTSSSYWFAGFAGVFVVLLAGWLFRGPLAQLAAQAEAAAITVEGSVVDADDKPLAGVTVLAVQKTWPNRRYQQRSLKTQTDDEGKFRFKDFATEGQKYGFLLTALSDKHSMTSFYQYVRSGKPHDPVTLRVDEAKPVTFTVRDPEGKPVEGLEVLPSSRTTADGTEHMTYAMQIKDAAKKTDADGKVTLTAWQAGEKGSLTLRMSDRFAEQDIKIPEDLAVAVTYVRPTPPKEPTGQPVSISGKVIDAAGEPIKSAVVLAVRKLWPNNRFRQDGLSTKTDAKGEFRFKDFAPGDGQYAVLLTVIENGYAMASDYRVVEDGSQQDPITITIEPAEPVTFLFLDRNGKPTEGVKAYPSQRESSGPIPHINYPLHREATQKTSDDKGEIRFSAWKTGEKGRLRYGYDGKSDQLDFQVKDDRTVEVKLQ